MSIVNISVTTKGLQAYWVAIGKKDVKLVNGKGSINLDPGPHIAVWYLEGNAGGSLSISGTLDDGTEVLSVKESKIPAGSIKWADVQPFNV
jgi:hypothetical protein